MHAENKYNRGKKRWWWREENNHEGELDPGRAQILLSTHRYGEEKEDK